ncbi:glycosyl hydrolase family protein [Jiangella aurantiaca]|uniref:licheninase n=1 Tax=Jiangella aurantiaca TaxID=2530373 RepID=A0A4V2YT63_9ACTN|nr:family 16 glycosylhydrolase [Jiangella aurantiaca]TDD72637.1 glycosyl hydrolase family protein [Jiangella aurantiaca]
MRLRLGLAATVLAALAASALVTAPSSAQSAPAAAQENLIVNGDFAEGVAPWTATAGVGLEVVDGQLCAAIPGGTAWPGELIVNQGDLALTAGENYTLTFTARASRTLYTQPVVRSTTAGSADFAKRIQLTTTAQTLSFVFTANATGTAGYFRFNAGGHAQPWTLCMDDVSLTGGAGAPPPDLGPDSFVDEFDTGVDNVFWYTPDGYNNGSHQNCQFNAANVATSSGVLTLSLDDTPYGDRSYSCGAIQTSERYGYGTYETRMQAGRASGTNSSLFSYIGPYNGYPHDEIDFEVLGKDPTNVDLNSWVNGSSRGPWVKDIGYDTSTQWVDFAWIWEPDRLRFYINGQLVEDVTDPADIPTNRQQVFTMIWGSDTLTGWMGEFVYPGAPVTAEYEYVAFTRAGDECQFATSVACDVDVPPVTDSFVDDFDTLNTSRWAVSHGWNNGTVMNCIWDRAQVVASGGALNLSFAKKTIGDRQYACSEVQHREKLGYGVYEARVKGVAGSGLMSSFFSWVGAGTSSPEEAIDFIKLLGVDTGRVKFDTWINAQTQAAVFRDLPVPFDQGYIDYGVDWSATRLDFYVNGQLVYSITDPAKIPDRETNMFLNIWGSETTPEMGTFEDPGGTVTFQVDRVAYTAPGDDCQFTGSIACASTALLTADFETGTTTGWTTVGGTWNTTPDEGSLVYRQTSTSGEAIAHTGDATWQDYAVELRAKVKTANGNAGVLFRYADAGNFYMYRLNASSQRAELYKRVDGTFTLVASQPMTVYVDRFYDLRVEITGEHVDAFVDDIQRINWTNPVDQLNAGRIGLRTYSSGAHFDDIVVSS